jgi:glutathione S-transferase
MPSYKITYFNVRGYAEMSRLILEYAKQPYEDVRVEHAEWPKIKPNFPFGQLPVLEVDGKQLAQSCTIARYLARTFNLAGKDDFESAQVDMIADAQKDISAKLQPYFSVAAGHAEGDKDALKASVLIPTLDQYMSVFESLLKESGSGFFVKSDVTWVIILQKFNKYQILG